MTENCAEKNIKDQCDEILKKYNNDKDNLIQILNEVQEKFGYVPKMAQREIADYLKISMAEVYGVITFYSRFTTEAKYTVSVCLGTACFVKGSEQILNRAKEKLKIDVGETTQDGMFSLDATRCVGACGLAPVFMINDEVYGKATVKKLDEELDKLINN